MSNAQTEYENALPPEHPDLDPISEEFDLATRIIGDPDSGYTIVEYICSDKGGEYADDRWQTRRENTNWPSHTSTRWSVKKDEVSSHENGLEALEAANMYLPQSERKCMGSLLIMLGTMNADAGLTIFNRLSK